MLKRLEISNYAIIDRILLHFGPGLTILTGETGAGKSIIVGAVSLLLGDRITRGMLRKGTKRGYVEGEFDISGESSVLPPELTGSSSSLTVRREFTQSGGSRSFINRKPATVSTLRSVFSGLLDLHGQHQHQSLLYPENYFDIIDRFGGLASSADAVSASHRRLTALLQEKRVLEQARSQREEMRDFLEFQLKEIDQTDPKAGEDEELEREHRILQNAEKVQTLAQECYSLLYDADQSALASIRRAKDVLDELQTIDPGIADIDADLTAAAVSVEETAAFLQRYSGKIESNPERLEVINRRLLSLRQLQKKYGAGIAGILAKREEIARTLAQGENLDDSISAVSAAIDDERTQYGTACIALSDQRSGAAGELQKKTRERLKSLGMRNTLFNVGVARRERQPFHDGECAVHAAGRNFAGDGTGIDDIQFLIATGKQERVLPIAQIASGGELSRLMLALKGVLRESDRVSTLIFDEIDSGISGRIAAAVGRELRRLARVHQIVCITHLPQIAGMADHHYSVRKVEENGRVVTRVTELDPEGKKREIASLMAGDTVTDEHLKSAETLIRDTL